MAEEGSDKSDILHKHHNYITEYYSLLNSKSNTYLKNVTGAIHIKEKKYHDIYKLSR
jgi:hypothetical protein